MLRLFLQHILLQPSGLAAGGVHLDLADGPILLFARLASLLSDGDGLAEALDWKGASSMKPCVKCWNVVKKAVQQCSSAPSASVARERLGRLGLAMLSLLSWPCRDSKRQRVEPKSIAHRSGIGSRTP